MVRRDGHRQQAHQRMFVAVGRAASGCGLGRSYRTLPPLGRVHLLDNEEARIGDQIVVGRYRYRGAAFFRAAPLFYTLRMFAICAKNEPPLPRGMRTGAGCVYAVAATSTSIRVRGVR